MEIKLCNMHTLLKYSLDPPARLEIKCASGVKDECGLKELEGGHVTLDRRDIRNLRILFDMLDVYFKERKE